jgi:hypothetical protein
MLKKASEFEAFFNNAINDVFAPMAGKLYVIF